MLEAAPTLLALAMEGAASLLMAPQTADTTVET